MCEHCLKSASSNDKPFSEQSSSLSSRVLIRKKLQISGNVRTHKVPIEEMTDRWKKTAIQYLPQTSRSADLPTIQKTHIRAI